jgi:hypothetical protein
MSVIVLLCAACAASGPVSWDRENPRFWQRVEVFDRATDQAQRDLVRETERESWVVRRVDPHAADLGAALGALENEVVRTRVEQQDTQGWDKVGQTHDLRARLAELEAARVGRMETTRAASPEDAAGRPGRQQPAHLGVADLYPARETLARLESDGEDDHRRQRLAELVRHRGSLRTWADMPERDEVDRQISRVKARILDGARGDQPSALAPLSPAMERLERTLDARVDREDGQKTWSDISARDRTRREQSFLRALRPVAEEEVSAQLLLCLSLHADGAVPGLAAPAWCTRALSDAVTAQRNRQVPPTTGEPAPTPD